MTDIAATGAPALAQSVPHAAPPVPHKTVIGNTPDFAVPSALLNPLPPALIEPNIVDMLATAIAAGLATDVRGAFASKDVYLIANHVYAAREVCKKNKQGALLVHPTEEGLYDNFAIAVAAGWAARGALDANAIWFTAIQHIEARRRIIGD